MNEAIEADVAVVAAALQRGGLHTALGVLNQRTPFRFTGLYRFEGDVLRNVGLYDRWAPDQTRGADAPMVETYCAIVGREDQALEVEDGRADPRFPWMRANAVLSYCGAPIRDAAGVPVGTLCHFDLQPCQVGGGEILLLAEVAALFLPFFS